MACQACSKSPKSKIMCYNFQIMWPRVHPEAWPEFLISYYGRLLLQRPVCFTSLFGRFLKLDGIPGGQTGARVGGSRADKCLVQRGYYFFGRGDASPQFVRGYWCCCRKLCVRRWNWMQNFHPVCTQWTSNRQQRPLLLVILVGTYHIVRQGWMAARLPIDMFSAKRPESKKAVVTFQGHLNLL